MPWCYIQAQSMPAESTLKLQAFTSVHSSEEIKLWCLFTITGAQFTLPFLFHSLTLYCINWHPPGICQDPLNVIFITFVAGASLKRSSCAFQTSRILSLFSVVPLRNWSPSVGLTMNYCVTSCFMCPIINHLPSLQSVNHIQALIAVFYVWLYPLTHLHGILCVGDAVHSQAVL